jgi:hypothetical protein
LSDCPPVPTRTAGRCSPQSSASPAGYRAGPPGPERAVWLSGQTAAVLAVDREPVPHPPGGRNGVEASIGATYETFDHVPDAKHDTNAKAGVKLEFPVREGVEVPVSVTWVNHKDLLSDEDEIVGHFGVSFDASGLLKKKAKGT